MLLRTRMPRIRADVLASPSSLLFDLRAIDVARFGELVARSGEAGVLTRDTSATLVDGAGRPMYVGPYFPRVDTLDIDGDGVREAAFLVLERASTNRVRASGDFGNVAYWGANNGPTRAAAAVRAGDVALDLIGDASGAATAFYDQAVPVVGNGTKTLSLFVKKGPNPAAGGSLVFLSDFTAPADRANAVLTFDVNGVPTLTPTAGTALVRDYALLENGIWRIAITAPGVLAANNNVVRVTPAQVLAEQGNVYVGGIQVEDNAAPSSYAPTVAAAVPRSADAIAFTIATPPVFPCTVLVDVVLPHAAQGRAVDQLLRVGTANLTDDAQAGFGLYRDAASNIGARVVAGGAHVDAIAAMGNGGSATRHRLLMTLDGANVSLSIDGGATVTSAAAMPAAFAVPRVELAGDNNLRLATLKIAAGVRTLAQMVSA